MTAEMNAAQLAMHLAEVVTDLLMIADNMRMRCWSFSKS